MRAILVLFDFLRQLAKLPGQFVTCLCLELCELPGFLTGQEQNQSFKFGCRLVGVVSLSQHQMFKLTDCFIVIHIFSLS